MSVPVQATFYHEERKPWSECDVVIESKNGALVEQARSIGPPCARGMHRHGENVCCVFAGGAGARAR